MGMELKLELKGGLRMRSGGGWWVWARTERHD